MSNTRQLEAFRKRILVTSEKFGTFLDKTTNKLGNKFLADVIKKTPVNKDIKAPTRGQLRRNWQITAIKGSGAIRSVKIYNNTSYAFFVENGHRKPNGTGWVEGQFFLRNTKDKFDREKQDLVDAELKKYLNSTLYRGRRRSPKK